MTVRTGHMFPKGEPTRGEGWECLKYLTHPPNRSLNWRGSPIYTRAGQDITLTLRTKDYVVLYDAHNKPTWASGTNI